MKRATISIPKRKILSKAQISPNQKKRKQFRTRLEI